MIYTYDLHIVPLSEGGLTSLGDHPAPSDTIYVGHAGRTQWVVLRVHPTAHAKSARVRKQETPSAGADFQRQFDVFCSSRCAHIVVRGD